MNKKNTTQLNLENPSKAASDYLITKADEWNCSPSQALNRIMSKLADEQQPQSA